MRFEDLLDMRQVVVAGRDGEHGHPRSVFSRQLWRTDNPHIALSLEAGIGWARLPRALVQPMLAKGRLVELAFANISANQVSLWVDVVWSRDRPLGLGARRYIELCRQRRLKTLKAAKA